MSRTPPRGRGHAALVFERRVRDDLHRRRWLRWHVTLIGTLSFFACWGLSHGLLQAGVESMALRHPLALLGAYGLYLGLLWCWARWLLSRDEGVDPGIDLLAEADLPAPAARAARLPEPAFESGGGGDFGGGGASLSFDAPGDGASGSGLGAVADAVGGADEGAVVVLPLALVVGAALLLASGLGLAVFGLFGIEVLLGVAVEIAFASVGGALALKARREGWLAHAFRRTAAPMAGLVLGTAALGAALAHWLPQAHSLPQALKLLFA